MRILCLLLISLFIFASSSQAALAPSTLLESLSLPVQVERDEKIVKMVEKLEKCESGSRNVCVMDTNGKLSCGVLQYQLGTFKSFMRRYNVAEHAEYRELENLWLDSEIQRLITYNALEEDIENLYHWKNCAIAQNLIL